MQPTERIARTEVLVEQDFVEPVFPVPTPIGAVRNGTEDAPYHAVICGENYHAIQALLAAYDRSFDLIYLDPPYNTGNRDWSYNNDYVDSNDTYRPSKWLAFMERRLRVAQRLLKPDGVIVVTIDENEVHHPRDAARSAVPRGSGPDGHDRHQPVGHQRRRLLSR
jgi:adenine-specific DNA-methyltransferase